MASWILDNPAGVKLHRLLLEGIASNGAPEDALSLAEVVAGFGVASAGELAPLHWRWVREDGRPSMKRRSRAWPSSPRSTARACPSMRPLA